MVIKPEDEEEISYEELKIELDYLSKEWNLMFKKYLEGWEIVGCPKIKTQKPRK